MDRIPFLSLGPGPDDAAVREALDRVLTRGLFVLGPEGEAFEAEFARASGAAHAAGVGNGTDALALILRALDIGPGDDVVVPAISAAYTALAVTMVGARPVFADVEPGRLTMDPRSCEARITARTRAIIPVHLFGQAADLTALEAVARASGAVLVEDCCQAHLATYAGTPVGTRGLGGAFSFYPTKNLGALGEAGLLTTNDPGLASRARLLRSHGMEPKYYHHLVGGNFRMDELQAAVLRVKAPHLAAWTEARRLNARRYARLFRDAGLEGRVTLPVEPPGRRHIFNQFVIRTGERDQLKRHLDSHGIGNEIYYPVPFHLQPCFGNLGYQAGAFPHAERAAADSLALPIYGELTLEQQQTVVEAVADVLRT